MRRHAINTLKPTYLIASGLAALIALGAPTAASAAPAADSSSAVQTATGYRQLIGEVSTSTYLEASVPDRGTYLIEYEITGLAFFDTYVDGIELGYVGGSDGVYQTRALQLSAGGHLVEAVGPEGSGTANVYIVKTS